MAKRAIMMNIESNASYVIKSKSAISPAVLSAGVRYFNAIFGMLHMLPFVKTVYKISSRSLRYGLMIALCLAAHAQVSVTTYHNDISRTGQNTQETILTPANVGTSQFGKLFTVQVDGQIYAQPLYLANLSIAGGTHNVVFVATEGDSVYAFDADSGVLYWHASMIDTAHGAASGATTVNISDIGNCGNITPQIGITSTPVIDLSRSALYVEAKSKENGTFVQRLHALNLASGNEQFPGPVAINGSSQGASFDPLHHLNRPGLLLMNGIIYVGFGSHCDFTPYHGWVFAYNASNFAQSGVFVSTPNQNVSRPPNAVPGAGAFWAAGAGLAGDGASLYAATGNGDFDNLTDFSDSIVKLTLSAPNLLLSDWFTPFDQATLNQNDTDLGSGGVLLLPTQSGSHPRELVQVGKEGTIYVINRDQMTVNNQHFCSGCTSNPQIVQEVPSAVGGMWSMPAYWNNNVYFWGVGDNLKKYSLSSGLLSTAPQAISPDAYAYPGATPSISSNGTSNGIVWTLKLPSSGPAVLRAHDAASLNVLYLSDRHSNLDNVGMEMNFTVPTVANGKVYAGGGSGGAGGQLSVYGLLPPPGGNLLWSGPGVITSGNGNPALVQSHYGIKGNFELVVPARSGGGLLTYVRNNDDPNLPWIGPTAQFGQTIGQVSAVTMIESNYSYPGNLEVVALAGGNLYHLFRDSTTLAWSSPVLIAGGIVGNPVLLQSHFGVQGNFELVALSASGGLVHFSRSNDTNQAWSGPTAFGQSLGVVNAVTMIASNYSYPDNLEVIARVGGTLYSFFRGSNGVWSGPSFVASGATGIPSMIQSRYGNQGNFELVAPSASGGLMHFFRSNDTNQAWNGPTLFGQSTGVFDSVSLIESNFGPSPGNFEVVAHAGSTLYAFFRD
jgi:hypothetical protein